MSEKRIGLPIMGQRPEPTPAPGSELLPDAPLRDRIVAAIETVYDPEIPVNVYELGLIYKLDISDVGAVQIDMTLTTPNCPVAGSLVGEVQKKVAAVAGVSSSAVNLVWEPPWDKSKMSEAAAMFLGLD
jgi:FeS assembly SUF system protein